MTRILGLDLSLAKTGVAHLDEPNRGDWRLRTHRIATPPHDQGDPISLLARMTWIRLSCSIQAEHCDLVVMEGPSFASVGSASKDLIGLWWLVFDCLTRDCRVLVVPPSTLKKWATGKGNVGKQQVGIGVDRTFPQDVFGCDFTKVDDNEVDAAALCGIGAQILDLPVPIEKPKYRVDAIATLRLPSEEAA